MEGEALTKFLSKQLKKGYIRPSKSPYASPFFIKKKSGELQPVQEASARTQVTARLFTGAQQESSASCTSSQVKYRVII